MTEQELIRRLREARPAPPAGFEERQAKLLLSLTQKEEKPIMKRKMSAALVFAVVLVLLSVSAFAASLVFSPKADTGLRADKVLEEKYGSQRFLSIIAIVALVTGLVHIFLPGRSALLGASGVDFALILLASVTGSRTGNAIPLTLIIVAIIYIGQQVYQGLTTADNISQLTHIIGGSIGAVYGMAVQRGKH